MLMRYGNIEIESESYAYQHALRWLVQHGAPPDYEIVKRLAGLPGETYDQFILIWHKPGAPDLEQEAILPYVLTDYILIALQEHFKFGTPGIRIHYPGAPPEPPPAPPPPPPPKSPVGILIGNGLYAFAGGPFKDGDVWTDPDSGKQYRVRIVANPFGSSSWVEALS